MDKVNKICLIIIIICTILVLSLCGFAIYHHNQKEEKTFAMRFQEEMEALNDKEIDGVKYLSVSIDKLNPMEYKTPKEILDVMKEEKAIIYFGFASSKWQRNTIETFLEAMNNKSVRKVYYVDIRDIRDEYVHGSSIKPDKTKNGTTAYYDILHFFGNKLDMYFVKDSYGNGYSTGVTRLYASTVIVVDDGKITDMHVAGVKSQTDPSIKLTDEQHEELLKIYEDMADKLTLTSGEVCGDDAC